MYAYLAFAPLIGYLGDKMNRKYLIIIATLLEMTSVITGSTIDQAADALRHRIKNITFNNTTELNSVI